MRRIRLLTLAFAWALILAGLPYATSIPVTQAHGGSHVAVTTRSYNNARTGANLQETILNTTNVRPGTFGKLFSRDIDGQMYAQPLYLPDLAIPGKGTHNVVFVATTKNNLYAFDADDPGAATPLWQVNLGQHAESVVCDVVAGQFFPVCTSDFGNKFYGTNSDGQGKGRYLDIQPNVGIIGTPVIDAATETLYVVTFERLGAARPFTYRHRLHAIHVLTGAEQPNSPVVIQATYPGTSGDNVNGVLTFNSKQELQRTALTLHKGVVYFTFAGYADTDPYHGWLFGYDAASLQQRFILNTSPEADVDNSQPNAEQDGEGGIWMSGQGISVDTNDDMYLVVANGNYNLNAGGKNLGNSVLRLRPPASGTVLALQTFFTPFNWKRLNDRDWDLGVTGAVLIPDTNYVVAGSKEGKIYVLDRANMGGLGTNDDSNAAQVFLATKPGRNEGDILHIHGSPVYWNSPTGGRLFLQSEQDRLRAFSFNGTRFTTTPVMTGTFELAEGMPGGIASLSANASTPGSGIVWVTTPFKNQDANSGTRSGELRAYDASATGDQDPIWSSSQSSNDTLGNFAKFNLPLVVDGKVFVGDFGVPDDPTTNAVNEFHQDKLVVYGLLKPALLTPATPQTITYGQNVALKVTATGAAPLVYQWYMGESGDESKPVSGATGPSFAIASVASSTRFWVKIINSYGSVNSSSTLINVNPAATTLTLTSSAASAFLGQPITLRAAVVVVPPGGGTPVGTVTFRDSGAVLGVIPVAGDGAASFTTSGLAPGTHVIGATYSGPTFYTQSTAADIQVTVDPTARIWLSLITGQ